MFYQRLIKFRKELGLNQKEFADKLDISESYYNLIENGKRSPSKNVMIKLVGVSRKPEEYWLYGIEEKNYINERDDLKNTYSILKMLTKGNLINNVEDIFNIEELNQIDKLIATAIKSDLSYMIKKKQKKES